MKIEILCTGDEILSGKTVNTNYSQMARRLQENGFNAYWGTVVGDDRESLEVAFQQAAERADVVIVNGGLGPTVDDLSQEVAAHAAGVELELREEWLNHIRGWYESRGRKMPGNNDKQAMRPMGAELIDNPVGTACGFAISIKQARFMFTPGVPMEMRKMMEEQILPRLIEMRGTNLVTGLKRFHTFGLGESRADMLLKGVEDIIPGGLVKLGFQSHFPQLEIKLTTSAENEKDLMPRLAPVVEAVNKSVGDYIVAEDDETLEGIILRGLENIDGSVSVFETLTAGAIFGRLCGLNNEDSRFKWGLASLDYRSSGELLGLVIDEGMQRAEVVKKIATALKSKSGATHGLAVLVDWQTQNDSAEGRPRQNEEQCVDVFIGVSSGNGIQSRTATFPGSIKWVKSGITELALDCLRRSVLGLPMYQRTDFEQHDI